VIKRVAALERPRHGGEVAHVDGHAFDIEAIEVFRIGAWLDERIVDFVRTYLAVHENEFYLKAHMVEDPVAHVRFPDFAAASTLERGGKTLYFIANETREEFEAKEKKQKSAG